MRCFWRWEPCTSDSLLRNVNNPNMKVTTSSIHKSDVCLRWRSRRCLEANSNFGRILAIAFGLLLAGSVHSQQSDVTPTDVTTTKGPQTNSAINVEEADAAKASKEDSSEWDWDWDSEGKGRHGVRREAVVAIWQNAELKAEDRSEAVVAIGGSATALGPVREAVVAIAGDVQVESRADAAIAVFGGVIVGPNARVRDPVVAVGGDITIR